MKKRTPHVRIDTRVFDLIPHIGSNGFTVYAALKKFENRHTGRCYPSYQTLADTTNLDRKTVIKYVDLLVEYKLIDKRARFIDGHQTSNQYDMRSVTIPPPPGVTIPPTQDRVETSDGGGGNFPPIPLILEPVITKRQMECLHKDIGRLNDGVAYCRTCYANIDIATEEVPMGDQSNSLTALSESGVYQIAASNNE